ncbi:MAG: Xaa-Pro aminopeptidase [Oceanospirillales bacterium LUC14_002_19_P2]|nr:MAG: Xaa-Pro aminopeptidase [Oceanospirillales bacterium LUC14_002_19_P2]
MKKLAMTEYGKRRQQLMQQIGADGVAILPAASEKIRNRDSEYLYRQDSDFYYLTGFNEPEAVLVLMPGREGGESILFCRDRDPLMETWHGRRAGQKGAVQQYGLDQAFSISELDQVMPGLLDGRQTIYYTLGVLPEFDGRLNGWVNNLKARERRGAVAPSVVSGLDLLVHEMRLFKSDAELEIMREACAISAGAHRRAMAMCRPGLYEYQLEAELQHEFIHHGARVPAYNSIVGSGDNACILHYTENDRQMCDGDLVLIDAGCELDNYAADITRTFPVNGVFSTEQRALYKLVLKAQEQAIATIRPGNPWTAFHDAAVRTLTEGLVDLGILSGDVDQLIKDEAYRPFYMHGTGHWLGMDVHDVGNHKVNGQWRKFEPGMVLTVEPGLYIAPDNADVEEKWRGIGIRIEDNVLMTAEGCEILTSAAEKDPDAIEALMKGQDWS